MRETLDLKVCPAMPVTDDVGSTARPWIVMLPRLKRDMPKEPTKSETLEPPALQNAKKHSDCEPVTTKALCQATVRQSIAAKSEA